MPATTIGPPLMSTDTPPPPATTPFQTTSPSFSPTPKPLSTSSKEVYIDAAVSRTETGLRVQPGQRIVIEQLSGSWQAGPSPTWPQVGADGDKQVQFYTTFPVPDHPIMTLIGGTSPNEVIAIGSRLEFVSSEDGYLWLGPNDDNVTDNTGQLLVL